MARATRVGTNNPNNQTQMIPSVTKGEPVLADRVNAHIAATNQLLRGNAPPSQIYNGPARGLIQMKVVTIEADYLTCHTWDGTNEGTIAIPVAKPYLLRNLAAWSTYTYTYADEQHRTSDDGATTEDQTVTPLYVADDIIFCQATNFTNIGDGVTTDMKLVDANLDGRQWAKDA